MKYVRIYADADGASHFDEVETEWQATEYVPGYPMSMTQSDPATMVRYATAEPGYFQPWHVSPRRHICVTLAGEWEIGVSDGEKRRFKPGEAYLGEDLVGQGHESRVVSDVPWLALIVSLPPLQSTE